MSKFSLWYFYPYSRTLKFLHKFATVTLGNYSYMIGAKFADIWDGEHVLIGDFCSIADELTLIIGANHNHQTISTFPFDSRASFKNCPPPPEKIKFPSRSSQGFGHQIIIGNDVWIGYNVTIMGGVRIGNGAIIGANTVVAKDIPPYAIAVGNPARVIKYRFDPETIRKLQVIRWWNWDLEKIYENLQLMIDSPEEFVDRNYSPDLEKIPSDKLGNQLRELKSRGFRIFSSILDFDMETPIWNLIAEKFTSLESKNSILIFQASLNAPQDLVKNVQDFIDKLDANIIVTRFSIDALLESDILITTHSPTTSIALDYLSGTNCKPWYVIERTELI